jgi:hypothetical protein
MTKSKSSEPHPLEDIAWRAFAENDCQDATTLAYFFAGASVHGGDRAYHTVAREPTSYTSAIQRVKMTRNPQLEATTHTSCVLRTPSYSLRTAVGT